MESVFNDHVFPKYMSQQVMKPQMDGFSDTTLRNFSLLDLSALMKDELKADRFDDEFIQSFLNAAKELAAAGRRAIDRPGMYVMLEHSYAIPVMFLTRHCIELAIKRTIKRCGAEPKKDHNPYEPVELFAFRGFRGKGAVRTIGPSRTWVLL